jgi:hypothetical protein
MQPFPIRAEINHLYFFIERRVVSVLLSSVLAYTIEFSARFCRFKGATFLASPEGRSGLLSILMGLFETLCLVFRRLVSLAFSGDFDFLPLLRSVLISLRL